MGRDLRQVASEKHKRVLLKLSGESLLGEKTYGIDEDMLAAFAQEIKEAVETGIQLAVVVGGGNIFRGVQNATRGMKRAHADYMGMLATMINAMALQDILEQNDLETRLQSGLHMEEVAEPFIRRRAIHHLEKGRVVIFGAGTGKPFFTTDTAAALRGLEIEADVLLKGTRVNGVFSADPEEDPQADRYLTIHGNEVISRSLRVMDMTAFTLCQESRLPIIVFDMNTPGDLKRAVTGEEVGTLVHWEEQETSATVAASSR